MVVSGFLAITISFGCNSQNMNKESPSIEIGTKTLYSEADSSTFEYSRKVFDSVSGHWVKTMYAQDGRIQRDLTSGPNQQVIMEKIYSEEGKLDYSFQYDYEDGKYVGKSIHFPNGNRGNKWEARYENELLVAEIISNAEGVVKAGVGYDYDQQGRMIRSFPKSLTGEELLEGEINIYTYDSSDRLVRLETRHGTSPHHTLTEFSYDANGTIVEEREYDERWDHKLISRVVYTYR